MTVNIYSFRIRFKKMGKMRFVSHHELMRLFARAIRRSGIPIRMTEGFNPHPILSFPTALGIGIESLDEVLELELASWLAPRQIQERLGAQLPAGIELFSVVPFRRQDRSYVDFVEYETQVPGQTEGVEEKIRAFFDRDRVEVVRDLGDRKKKVDIRPFVMAIEPDEGKIFLRIQVTDSGSARPEEVLEAMGIELRDDARVTKTHTELKTR